MISYLKNEITAYTSTISNNESLHFDSSIYYVNTSISNIVMRGGTTVLENIDASFSSNTEGVSISGHTITKTKDTDSFDTGAFFNKELKNDVEVSVHFHQDDSWYAFGLSRSDVDHSPSSIDYGFIVRAAGNISHALLSKNGVAIASIDLSENDVLKLQRVGTIIHYMVNDTVVHSEYGQTQDSLYFDSSIITAGGKIHDIQINEDLISQDKVVSFVNVTNVTIEGNTLTKTSSDGWNAGAFSKEYILKYNTAKEIIKSHLSSIEIELDRLEGVKGLNTIEECREFISNVIVEPFDSISDHIEKISFELNLPVHSKT